MNITGTRCGDQWTCPLRMWRRTIYTGRHDGSDFLDPFGTELREG